jgi:tRNA dimethylallyltransferase
MARQKLIVICGPTASGKSKLAVEVALKYGGEVVSADSMQLYRGMDIGTAKITTQEMRGVPHHMLDCAEIGGEAGAAIYREQARECIAEIGSRGKLPILCGGTGLYISAVVYPLDFANARSNKKLRTDLQAFVSQHGASALHDRLRQKDPAAASAIHPNNIRRIIRAIEKTQSSDAQAGEMQPLFNGEPLYELAWIGLTMDRQELYKRIDGRVDAMMRQGLLEEVRRLSTLYGRNETAFQALGYKELLAYFGGKITLEEAIAQIKAGTRNYAKRQMTWFRRENRIRWFDCGILSYECLLNTVFEYIENTLQMS